MTTSKRLVTALALALVVHAVVLCAMRLSSSLVREAPHASTPITLAVVPTQPHHEPQPKAQVPRAHAESVPPRTTSPTSPAPDAVAPVTSSPTASAAPTPAPATSSPAPTRAPAATPQTSGPRIVSSIDHAVQGALPLALQPSSHVLEGALDEHAAGPETDNQRAKRLVDNDLRSALAAHDARIGLANDWFRTVGHAIERTWHPQARDLNDGGKQVEPLTLLAGTLGNPLRWNEASHAMLDDAVALQDGFRGNRTEKIADALTNHAGARAGGDDVTGRVIKGAGTTHPVFGLQVGVELRITHDGSGAVTSIDIIHGSGQPRIDQALIDDVTRAIALESGNVSLAFHGKPFSSRWLLTARWAVTPPSCMATPDDAHGTGALPVFGCSTKFDVTSKGVEVDLPGQVKLKTEAVLLEARPLT